MHQISDQRKAYLKELNEIVRYTGEILHGEELTTVRIRQYKKYFNKTYKMLHRLVDRKSEINNNSFKYGYGGKIMCRQILLQFGVIRRIDHPGKRALYELSVPVEALNLELVSRIVVEVYLKRNDISTL